MPPSLEEFDKKVRGMHPEDVILIKARLLGQGHAEPTGPGDDRDWLVQLYRSGEIDAYTITTRRA